MATKAIGPTFSVELKAAGLFGLPFCWSSDGTFIFDPAMTAEQITGVEAVYAAHDPSKELVLIPQEVSAYQARAALLDAGLLTAIEAYFNDPTTDPKQALAWHNATTFSRNSPTLAAAAMKFNLSSDQLDALFIAAAKEVA